MNNIDNNVDNVDNVDNVYNIINIDDTQNIQDWSYHYVFAISVLYGLSQIFDFYLSYHYYYYGTSDLIAFDIYTSFWFLINGIIGIQYSVFISIYYLLQRVDIYRTIFVFTYGMILTLAMIWTTIGFIGYFNKNIPFYFVIKLTVQSTLYVFTVGVCCN